MIQPKYKRKLDDLLAICRKNLRSVNEDLITRAFEFSLEAHKHDIRASGEPYFYHPYEVATVVAKEIALDDVSVACALLHDVAEDTEFGIKDIRQEFGDTIADIVDGTTKITDIFRSHEITKAESYRKLLLSMVNDIRVMIVKFADRLHNMRTLEYLPAEKQERLSKETLDIYAPFAHRFGLAKIKWELEDLAFKHLHRKEYEEIAHAIKSKRREREHYIRKFTIPIEKRLKEEDYTFEIEGRPKHLYSIYNKMVKRGKPLEEIYDMFAVRIVLDTADDNKCFSVYGIVSEIYKPISERFKNYISIPKKNGYQSLHTTVIGPEGKMVEVQIRTKSMHEIAERGVAAHWMYKENVATLDKELENWVNWVREIFDQRDDETPKELMESFKLNLYQDEIYVFTPKGDIKILPKGATPIDFGFEIHSNVGSHTIGAKVNGRIVPLNTILQSGDQVEIITSKKQTPNVDWEKFAVTHKAKSAIRRWIKEEERRHIEAGKELWDKRIKKAKLHINEDELAKFVHLQKIANTQDFYLGISNDTIDAEAMVGLLLEKTKRAEPDAKGGNGAAVLFDRFVKSARSLTSGISIFGTSDNFMHNYAKCCNPIPGDEIVGFITTGEGLKIHRKNCRNVAAMRLNDEERIVEVSWPPTNDIDFIAGIKLSGQDRSGLLNEITHAISTYNNTNIRSVNIATKDSLFDGQFILYVKNTEHLSGIVERLKRLKGISKVERFEDAG
ncbi:MAG TPA: bifunctional (p)ppGpp synthetase/guanosine-3',5'-bis(diphosphate) 3'-pyrophosphohydrolase [Bacteroidota bacterium]|nr:bifunctional (p)ppGpp synthetase/guanosine-3',5'-bis(diphosphate) 3'-pyrophosphohydrolase [Bacteroidota bacterium]